MVFDDYYYDTIDNETYDFDGYHSPITSYYDFDTWTDEDYDYFCGDGDFF